MTAMNKMMVFAMMMGMGLGCAGCLPDPTEWVVEKRYHIPDNIPAGGQIKWMYPFSLDGEWRGGSITVGEDGTSYLTTILVGDYSSFAANPTDSRIHAMNPDGTSKWIFELGMNIKLYDYAPVIGPDGTIYQQAQNHISSGRFMSLYAISPEGIQKWITRIPEEFMSEGPMIDRTGTIYLQASTSYEHPYQLYAFDADGTEKWATGSEITWPLSFIGMDGILYNKTHSTGSTALTKRQATNSSSNLTQTLQALNSSDGSVLREVEILDKTIMPVVSTEGTIYARNENRLFGYSSEEKRSWTFTAAYYETITSLSLGAENAVYAIAEYIEVKPARVVYSRLYALNADGQLKWQLPIGSGFPALQIGPDGSIYLLSNQVLYAVNPDGSWKWRFDSEETFKSLKVGPEGTIYLIATSGKLYAVEDTGAAGE